MQEYWIELLFLPLGNITDPEIEPVALAAPALQGGSLPLSQSDD